MVMTSMRQRDEDEGERRDPRPDHPNEDGPRGGDANQCRQPRFLVSARCSEKCHDRPGTQVRSIRSGMGVSITSDVKGPPPNRMADSVQYDPLEHYQRNTGALRRPTPFSDDCP